MISKCKLLQSKHSESCKTWTSAKVESKTLKKDCEKGLRQVEESPKQVQLINY